MRLRFSLRLAFVVTTLLAAALYWFVARPTILAHRFAAAVNKRDYETAKPLLPDFWLFSAQPDNSIDLVFVEVLPREWSDIWNSQRRLILRLGRHQNAEGRHVEWTEDTDVVAHINGLEKIVKFFPGWMTD